MAALAAFLRVWHPKTIWTSASREGQTISREAARASAVAHGHSRALVVRAWTPWAILSVLVFLWGLPQVKASLNGRFTLFNFPIEGLHNQIERVPPVVAKAAPEAAVYTLNWLSATGSGILIAAIVAGLVMGFGVPKMAQTYWHTLKLLRFSLLTIAAMLALGFTTRCAGLDATLGLAFAKTGWLYPFFGAAARLARRRPHRLRHLFERAVRRAAEDLGAAARALAGADGRGQQLGRGHGQDDRRAEHRGRLHGHAVVWTRGRDPALRVLPQPRPGRLVGLLVMAQAYVWPFTALVVH